jgi:hypothetical protein
MKAPRAAAWLAAAALTACTLRPPAPANPPVDLNAGAAGAVLAPADLAATVQREAAQIDHASGSAERSALLAAATGQARQCLSRAPENGACHYAQAQVLGLTARERPVQAVSLLKEMLARLARAEALDPAYDHAGPARLTAIVLLRAPGWPLGPGDADAAVAAAQRAVDRDPDYPPNLITLAQAQARTEDSHARETFEKAQRALAAWTGPDAADRDAWQRDVAQGLRDLP